jgi:hypothetical protein
MDWVLLVLAFGVLFAFIGFLESTENGGCLILFLIPCWIYLTGCIVATGTHLTRSLRLSFFRWAHGFMSTYQNTFKIEQV